jgi:hypothetical protein
MKLEGVDTFAHDACSELSRFMKAEPSQTPTIEDDGGDDDSKPLGVS